MANCYCVKCGKMLKETEFYTSNNVEKYPPNGRLSICKKCLTMHVDNWDPDTFTWILKEIDVPYIKAAWDDLLVKYAQDPTKVSGVTILGRYLSKMKLSQYRKYSWEDTDRLNEEATAAQVESMKASGMSEEEIQEKLREPAVPPPPTSSIAVSTPTYYDPETEEDDFSGHLTEEDKIMLRIKWGRGYRPEEWVRLEQLYNDMMASYDIQGAGMKDTLIMICKTSLKANQLLDAGDIESAQKAIKMYDSLMKSAKLTAAQNKTESSDFIDSVGELVALCEKEGFIPRYYTDGPQDKVDKVLQDLQHYTRSLVTEESNLENMIEASMRAIEQDRKREAQIEIEGTDDDDDFYSYEENKALTADDYLEFEDMKQEDKEIDEEGEKDDGIS